jgi:magnesium chelatase subunit D
MPGKGQSSIFETAQATGEPTDYEAAAASLSAELDRARRENSGRRQRTVSADGRGRYARSERPAGAHGEGDVAIDATIRAAAARGPAAQRPDGTGLRITPDDIRAKVRTRKTGTSIILVVDASGSMGASRRIDAAKAAAMQLLAEAYVRRDRVALVSFRGDSAHVVLPPTASVELARLKLGELPVGGSTPMAAGIQAALEVAAAEKRRDPTVVTWIVLITDGRANVGRLGALGSEDALKAARQAAAAGIHTVVIDTDTTGKGGAALSIATAAAGDYVRLPVISASGIVASVVQRVERP